MDRFRWVDEATIREAQLKSSEHNPCDTCMWYGAPRFVFNSGQWVNCPACNPVKKQGPRWTPEELRAAAERDRVWRETGKRKAR